MPLCSFDKCTTNAYFGAEGTRKALFCKQHAEDGMVDVLSKRCSHSDCTKHPTFATEGAKRALFCKQHAEDGMVNVRGDHCSHSGCTKQPTFATEGAKRALFCKQHAEDGMVDILHKRCSHSGCTKQPRWGLTTDSIATACAWHKGDLDGEKVCFFIECEVNGCRKIATRGPQGTYLSKRCQLHDPTANRIGDGRGKHTSSRRSTITPRNKRRHSDVDSEGWDKRARKAVPRNDSRTSETGTAANEDDPASAIQEKPKKMLLVWV